MTENCISSIHIQKLGHKIPEIRERALFSLISKLEHGFVYDNDLARSKEIVGKLLDWFGLEPIRQHEPVVLELIKRILLSESGEVLLNHYGIRDTKTKLKQIRTHIQPKHQHLVDEIVGILDNFKQREEVVVPPLETDVPLSYRTGQSEFSNRVVGTTATPIEGLVYEQSVREQQARLPTTTTTEFEFENSPKSLPNYCLPWQSLIETDQQVLQSVENSLKNPLELYAVWYSCEFFNDVLLHDFPAEIFLQRPEIVRIFHDLLQSCTSNRLVTEVINCLINLTKALRVRINHFNDPSTRNLKEHVLFEVNSPERTCSISSRTVREEIGLSLEIKSQQISFPYFSLTTIKVILRYLRNVPDSNRQNSNKEKFSHQINGINASLILLNELFDLLFLVMKSEIWYENTSSMVLNVIQLINEMMIEFGDVLEYFRIEVYSNESETIYRVVQLCLLNKCTKFLLTTIPLSQTGLVLPKTLKIALSNSLIDVTLAKLYPKVHQVLLEYVESFSISPTTTIDSLKKYKETDNICNSMSAAVKFLKFYKTFDGFEAIKLAEEALNSLEFHGNLLFIKYFIDICANKLPLLSTADTRGDTLILSESIILQLLSHEMFEIKAETYRQCHERLISVIGPPKLITTGTSAPISHILFLLSSKILIEIALFGVTNINTEIQTYSEDILIYLLKSKLLIPKHIWNNQILNALIESFPILMCHSGKDSCLGRTLIDIMDPDQAEQLLFPTIEIVKGNIILLFTNDSLARDEAFSRLCWLLALQNNSKEMLPRLNNLHDKALSNACQLKRAIYDVNKMRNLQHYYQPSNLQQVLEIFNSPKVEPIIRRSALTQASVMIEDPLLHNTFLENNGLLIVIDIMEKAMIEKNYENYPDSIIPAINILKNLCLYHSSCRQELANDVRVYFCILRGLFMFFTEERLRQDATTLLFLLIFHNFLKGNPSKADFSIPKLISNKLTVPFNCNNHWMISQYTRIGLKDLLCSDKWCLSSLQIQWNSEILGGFNQLLAYNEINYYNQLNEIQKVPDLLKLKNYDLNTLKSSDIKFCIQKYLNNIQNGTTHESVMDSVNCLTLYLNLYQISKTKDSLLELPWEITFTRFLKTLPSSDEDLKLLTCIVKFLKCLVSLYKFSDKPFWICRLLNDPTDCLLDLLYNDNQNYKILNQNLLELFTLMVSQEQHYLDYYTDFTSNRKISEVKWIKIIKVIADNLKFNDTEHFYNLAYLDCLLSCLVHLTANLGWSASKTTINEINLQLIRTITELIVIFHGGKGSNATISVMGLSITRHSLLILNHLLAEMQNCQNKNWDVCFLKTDNDDTNWLKIFLDLWSNRDVVLRAAVLQLFASLMQSTRLAIEIINEAKNFDLSIWDVALQILIDHETPSIVRENSANLLVNLTNHTTIINNKIILIPSLIPTSAKAKENKDVTQFLLDLLENYQFYKHLETILLCLYTFNMVDISNFGKIYEKLLTRKDDNNLIQNSSKSDLNSKNDKNTLVCVTTPSLIKNITNFLNNLLSLELDKFINKLQEFGLIKLLFRCLYNPTMLINNTKNLAIYCDIIEMNTTICQFLNKIIKISFTCLGTILYTKDCLNLMISLLNPKCYNTDFSQLLYLRNKLWSEVFELIATLVKFDSTNAQQTFEAFQIIFEILEELGRQPFLETLCESISSLNSNFLQNSALLSLTSLLRVETQKYKSKTNLISSESCYSMQTILDTVRTPRNDFIAEYDDNVSENEENIEPTNQVITTLRDKVYFVEEKQLINKLNRNNTSLMIGGEICKILLHLYDLSCLEIKNTIDNKKKSMIITVLTNTICISKEAKIYAINSGFLLRIIKKLKEIYIKLSLESVDCLRRLNDKKRVCPLLKELNELVGLLTNFIINDDLGIKNELTTYGLSDLIHKFWIWFCVQQSYLMNALQMLCNFTRNCPLACQSLPLTSSVAGSGPRKVPSNISLLHEIINLITKEMDQISKTHQLDILDLCFNILKNCCIITECRILLCKSNLLQNVCRLHPAITKKLKPWDTVELFWLDFLKQFTIYPEGQSNITKITDVLDLLINLAATNNTKKSINNSLLILRNLAFHSSNRTRLLNSGDFLQVLKTKLDSGSVDEKNLIVLIVWTLAANNQKAKIVFKSLGVDVKLEEMVKQARYLDREVMKEEDLERLVYVLDILRNNNTCNGTKGR